MKIMDTYLSINDIDSVLESRYSDLRKELDELEKEARSLSDEELLNMLRLITQRSYRLQLAFKIRMQIVEDNHGCNEWFDEIEKEEK